MKPHWSAIVTSLVVVLHGVVDSPKQAHASIVFGPVLPYTSFSDSPFSSLSFTYFHLETFESGAFPSAMSPGVTASTGVVLGPGALIDSVDGGGTAGHSFFSGDGASGITFTFDKNALGQLPTDAAIAWTDGDGPNRTFKAYDANNQLIGTIIDSSPSFYSSGGDGDPQNYRLFGAIDSIGISSIFIANDGGGIEVDHLQYGAALLGDVNSDGVVNGLDISLVASHWLQSGSGTPGDANYDGVVNGLDIAEVASHWLVTLSNGGVTLSVPEPTTLILALLGLIVFSRRATARAIQRR